MVVSQPSRTLLTISSFPSCFAGNDFCELSSFSVFCGLVKAFDLCDELNNKDSTFTVFAPLNAAFSGLDIDDNDLEDIVKFHIVPNKALTKRTLDCNKIHPTALSGSSVEVICKDVLNDDIQFEFGKFVFIKSFER